MKKIFATVLSLIIVLSLSACLPVKETFTSKESSAAAVSSDVTAPPPMDTLTGTTSPEPVVPEDIKFQDMCVLAYFDALRKNDANKIIQVSASSYTGKYFSNKAGSDFIGELFSISSAYDLLRSTWDFIYSILSDATTERSVYSKEAIEKFVREVDPANLSDIKVIELGTPLQKPQLPGGLHINNNAFTFRYCLFSIDDKTFCQIFWLIKASDGYKLAAIGEYDEYNNISGVAKPGSLKDFGPLVDSQTIDESLQKLPASGAEQNGDMTYLQKIEDTASPIFKSSKEAAEYFTEALGRRDPYAAISTFDVKEKASGFDLNKESELFSVFEPYSAIGMTTEYDFYRDINLAYNCSKNAGGLIMFISSFSFPADLNSNFSARDYLSAIVKSCKKINSISLVRSGIFAKTTTEKFREYSREQAAPYGADDMEDRIVEYKFNGKKYTGPMTLICYGGNWRIRDLNSPLLGMSTQVYAVFPSSKLDYDSYIEK